MCKLIRIAGIELCMREARNKERRERMRTREREKEIERKRERERERKQIQISWFVFCGFLWANEALGAFLEIV